MLSLKQKLKQGGLWNFIGLFSSRGIQILLKLILARILIPEDFGLFATTALIISTFDILKVLGAYQAFIQDRDSDIKKAKNTLFYLNCILDLFVFALIFFSAPIIAKFFTITNPSLSIILSMMIRVLAIQKIIKIFTNVPNATLNKEVKFKTIQIASIIHVLIYFIVSVILVFSGHGVWSLIYGQLSAIFAESIIIFLAAPFWPNLLIDIKIAKRYIKYGKNLLASSFVNIFVQEGDNAIIGRILGMASLGLYHLAEALVNGIVNGIQAAITPVIFPVFCMIQKNKNKMQRLYFRTFEFSNLIIVPAIGGIMILANDIIRIFLGEKWLATVPIIYVLSIAILLKILVYPAEPFFLAKNKPELIKNLSIINFFAYLILIYPFVRIWGILGAAYVIAIFSLIKTTYFSYYLSKEVPKFFRKFFRILIRYILITLIMLTSLYFIKSILIVNMATLFGLALLGIIIYIILIKLLDKEIIKDLHKFFIKRKVI